ncbi:MAG: hypothetical protein K0R29_895 [Pseudobdellovibrio sp.]|jgi:hypothetical protein|nr:hypothetical protein [Pseudobdellovibrio sp.]
MKKHYFFFVFFGTLLGYLAVTDHWFEDERDIYFPITAEQIRAGVAQRRAEQSGELSVLQSAKQRFDLPYKKNYERDLRERMQLLGVVAHSKTVTVAESKDFFLNLARNKNENILVRRQAYKHWLKLSSPQNSGLVQLASFSDETMLESLTQGQN